jgi:ATP adenylyltransferase
MAKQIDSGQTSVGNYANARTDEQVEVMKRAEVSGDCPFCRKNVTKYHPKPIIREGEFWLVTENMNPYDDTKHHFLLIYTKGHVKSIDEIPPVAFVELHKWICWLKDWFSIEGGTLLFRFGNNRYNGGSVNHLHAQIIVGDVDNPGHKGVRVKIG